MVCGKIRKCDFSSKKNGSAKALHNIYHLIIHLSKFSNNNLLTHIATMFLYSEPHQAKKGLTYSKREESNQTVNPGSLAEPPIP